MSGVCDVFAADMLVMSVMLTCQSEQRGLAEAVSVSVFEQVEAGQRGVQEEAGFCVGLQGVVARDPGVPVQDKGGSIPECHAVLPLCQPHLATGARVQKIVWSLGCLERNPRCVCVDEKKVRHYHGKTIELGLNKPATLKLHRFLFLQ